MTFATAPYIIEQTDFSKGFGPDGPPEHTAPDDGVDFSINLHVDPSTLALVTRLGFDRIRSAVSSETGRYVKAITSVHAQAPSEDDTGGRHLYLVVVTTNGEAATNNVRIYAIDLTDDDLTSTRIDDSGVEWENPESDFWLIPVNNVLYGGSMGNPMFSWDGTDWDPDATVSSDWRTLVDDVDDGVNQTTERGRDFAWKGTEKVIWDGDDKVYAVQKGIRYDDWEDDQKYTIGDRVSRTHVWDSTTSYYKSFKCVQAHQSSDADTAPGSGANWTDYWSKVKLPVPQDEDGDTPAAWAFMPSASQTKVAAWFANRLWLRFDKHGSGRLQYSAPTRPQKDKDIPLTYFDPTDFSPGNDIVGPGGGWLAVNDGRQAGPVTALHAFNQYLLIFKRESVWALSGWSEESFNLHKLREGVGCVAANAHTEMDGICYFLSDDGLYMTDGTDVQAAPGNEGIRYWLHERQSNMGFTYDGTEGLTPQMWRFHEFIAISLYNEDDTIDGYDYLTMLYHPQTGSFWPTTLPISAAHSYSVGSADRNFFFAAPEAYGDGDCYIYRYGGYGDDSTDDDGASTDAEVDIEWGIRTTWWSFGVRREERRIRRTWALVKGIFNWDFSLSRNYDTNDEVTTSGAADYEDFSGYLEGQVPADAHSIQYTLSGDMAPAVVHGIGVHTQPRRNRYHT